MQMNHLDLFSGIGGFSLGLKRVFDIKHTYFSEIDKYAIDVYKHNFKNSTYVKSVTDVRGGELPRIDIITFGSPCQDFSLAGKRKGMDGERSSLITEAIRLIKECRPSFFIWENVKGTFSSNSGADFWAIIQAFTNIGGYRLEWQLLNTKWFLPQNRERIYLVGCLGKGSGRQIFPITESSRKINDLQRQQGNTCTLTTRYNEQGNGSYIIERELASQETKLQQIGTIGKDSEATRVYNTNCARTIKDGGGMGAKTGLYLVDKNKTIVHDIPEIVTKRKYEINTEELRAFLRKHKTKSIKQISKEMNMPYSQVEHWFRNGDKWFSIPPAEIWYKLKNVLNITETKYDKAITTFIEMPGTYEKTNRVYDSEGIAPTLTKTSGDERIMIKTNNKKGYEIAEPAVIGYSRDAKGKVTKRNFKQEANTLHSISGGGGNTDQYILETNYTYKKVNETIEKNKDKFEKGKPVMMDLHNRRLRDISPCLVEPHHNNSSLFNGMNIRRLTPIECERLQGFPDDWTRYGQELNEISDTQRYKMCGNAVTVDVVEAVAKKIKEALKS